MTYKTAILLIFNILYTLNSAAQSGWTRNKGGFFGKTGYYIVSGNTYIDVEGKTQKANTFTQQAFTMYGEYGITKNITAILNYPFVKFNRYDITETVGGIGDPQLELRFALLKKIPVVSAGIGIEVPLAKKENLAYHKLENPLLGIKEFVNLPTGEGDFKYWTSLSVSSGLGNTPGWLTIWGQYQVRGKDPLNKNAFHNRAKLGFELGYKWTTKFWTNARLVGLYDAQKNKTLSSASFTNGQGTQYSTLGLGASYEFVHNWNITFDYQNYNDFLVKKTNIYATPFFQLGVSAEFQ
jgi:hypothetical protein